MLLQTNSYIVPRDKRAEHARILRRFRQVLLRLGCDHFEVYEQVGPNWNTGETTGRFVQIMRFRDRRHQLDVQTAERNDPISQQVIHDFCELINFPYQQQQGLFAVGFYTSFLQMPMQRTTSAISAESSPVEEPGGNNGAAAAEAPNEIPQEAPQEEPASLVGAPGEPINPDPAPEDSVPAPDDSVEEEHLTPMDLDAPDQDDEPAAADDNAEIHTAPEQPH